MSIKKIVPVYPVSRVCQIFHAIAFWIYPVFGESGLLPSQSGNHSRRKSSDTCQRTDAWSVQLSCPGLPASIPSGGVTREKPCPRVEIAPGIHHRRPPNPAANNLPFLISIAGPRVADKHERTIWRFKIDVVQCQRKTFTFFYASIKQQAE